ncbi:hypothetical protein BC828DRAFT_377091 [Blastocladiella britannica]|nr:hypothetical protein BC828DRAFT_377091 [Blastocladiella britannica]
MRKSALIDLTHAAASNDLAAVREILARNPLIDPLARTDAFARKDKDEAESDDEEDDDGDDDEVGTTPMQGVAETYTESFALMGPNAVISAADFFKPNPANNSDGDISVDETEHSTIYSAIDLDHLVLDPPHAPAVVAAIHGHLDALSLLLDRCNANPAWETTQKDSGSDLGLLSNLLAIFALAPLPAMDLILVSRALQRRSPVLAILCDSFMTMDDNHDGETAERTLALIASAAAMNPDPNVAQLIVPRVLATLDRNHLSVDTFLRKVVLGDGRNLLIWLCKHAGSVFPVEPDQLLPLLEMVVEDGNHLAFRGMRDACSQFRHISDPLVATNRLMSAAIASGCAETIEAVNRAMRPMVRPEMAFSLTDEAFASGNWEAARYLAAHYRFPVFGWWKSALRDHSTCEPLHASLAHLPALMDQSLGDWADVHVHTSRQSPVPPALLTPPPAGTSFPFHLVPALVFESLAAFTDASTFARLRSTSKPLRAIPVPLQHVSRQLFFRATHETDSDFLRSATATQLALSGGEDARAFLSALQLRILVTAATRLDVARVVAELSLDSPGTTLADTTIAAFLLWALVMAASAAHSWSRAAPAVRDDVWPAASNVLCALMSHPLCPWWHAAHMAAVHRALREMTRDAAPEQLPTAGLLYATAAFHCADPATVEVALESALEAAHALEADSSLFLLHLFQRIGTNAVDHRSTQSLINMLVQAAAENNRPELVKLAADGQYVPNDVYTAGTMLIDDGHWPALELLAQVFHDKLDWRLTAGVLWTAYAVRKHQWTMVWAMLCRSASSVPHFFSGSGVDMVALVQSGDLDLVKCVLADQPEYDVGLVQQAALQAGHSDIVAYLQTL